MDFTRRDHDEAHEVFLPKKYTEVSFSEDEVQRATRPTSRQYWRLAFEILMATAIIALSTHLFLYRNNTIESAVPKFPSKTYIFMENTTYLHEDMFSSEEETLHTLHNWIDLSADGRGYVGINNSESFGLGQPYNIGTDSQPKLVYMMSIFHQLHCLSYIVQHFQTGFGGVDLTQEVAHHSAHCFDYLRQSLMCAADTSLEGETDAGPGWGSKHQCKDYDAVLAWANKHTVVPFRRNMPGTSVL